MALRWRKDPKETGLRAVGAGPRGSGLYLNDEPEYLARISPHGGGWRGGLEGWYWYCPNKEEYNIEWHNTYPNLHPTEAEAKDEAKKYIQSCLEQTKRFKVNKNA